VLTFRPAQHTRTCGYVSAGNFQEKVSVALPCRRNMIADPLPSFRWRIANWRNYCRVLFGAGRTIDGITKTPHRVIMILDSQFS